MKRNIIISVVLFLICSVVAVLMVLINSLTEPVIKDNEEKTTQEMLTVLFPTMKKASSMEEVSDDDYVVGIFTIYSDDNQTAIGHVYKASGVNGYGEISMLVGVNTSNKITGVQYLSNTQTKNGSTIEQVGYDYVTNDNLSDVTNNNIADIKAGVTYGSNLVNSIMSAVKAYAAKEA